MAGVTLHEADVFGIALRLLEEDLRSEDVKAVNKIQRELLLFGSAADGEF